MVELESLKVIIIISRQSRKKTAGRPASLDSASKRDLPLSRPVSQGSRNKTGSPAFWIPLKGGIQRAEQKAGHSALGGILGSGTEGGTKSAKPAG